MVEQEAVGPIAPLVSHIDVPGDVRLACFFKNADVASASPTRSAWISGASIFCSSRAVGKNRERMRLRSGLIQIRTAVH